FVDHHAVIDDEMYRNQRIDPLWIAPEVAHGVAHCGKVDDCGDPGEVLHQDPRRTVLDFAGNRSLLLPVDHRLEVVSSDRCTVLEAWEVFEQDLHREGQARNIA